MRATTFRSFSAMILVLAAAACSGPDSIPAGDSVPAARAAANPPVMSGVDGIPGWTRTRAPERYNKEGLYGYIDGGAEIVLQYGFRELAVSTFKPAVAPGASKEIVLEIYRMSSGEAAFGLYSTKLEGGEKGWPGIGPDNWTSLGQASLVKGEFLFSILAPECTDKEIGEFVAAVETKAPGHGTVRPEGMDWLPREGMIPSSWHYVKGPLAAQNESPFLEGAFWGFAETSAGEGATEAYSAKYGAAPAVSKLVVVKLGTSAAAGSLEDGVRDSFAEYFKDVKRGGTLIEGRNDAGRWFLFKRAGSLAALVLGEPDETAARARLEAALGLATPHAASSR